MISYRKLLLKHTTHMIFLQMHLLKPNLCCIARDIGLNVDSNIYNDTMKIITYSAQVHYNSSKIRV